MSENQQKKAKWIKNFHIAADKIGKFGRKILPWCGGIVLGAALFGSKATSDKSDTKKA